MRETRVMTSLTLVVLAPRVLLELELQVARDAEQDDGAGPRERALAAGGREGDVERVGEQADGDVVEAGPAAGCLAHERLLQREGILTRMPFFFEVLALKVLAL